MHKVKAIEMTVSVYSDGSRRLIDPEGKGAEAEGEIALLNMLIIPLYTRNIEI